MGPDKLNAFEEIKAWIPSTAGFVVMSICVFVGAYVEAYVLKSAWMPWVGPGLGIFFGMMTRNALKGKI